MTELRPSPIRSDTSRRGTAGAPAGEPGAARRRPARSDARWTKRLRRSRRTTPRSHVNAKSCGLVGPCATPLARGRRPDAARSPRLRGALTPARHGRGSVRLRSPDDRPGPRAASPDAPRRASGSADTRGAFHRRAAPSELAPAFARGARTCAAVHGFRCARHVGQDFSTGCYQPVENTRRL